MIYIIIPIYNRWHYTKDCLKDLFSQNYNLKKVIVVDHGSTDGSIEYINELFPDVIIIKGNENMWWTGATNYGVQYAIKMGAEYILTLNNDVKVNQNYLNELIRVAKKYPNSLVGSVSFYSNEDGKIAFLGIKWNRWLAKFRSTVDLNRRISDIQNDCEVVKSDLLPGRGTLIPASAFHEVGLFDEKNFPHYAADEDFSLRCSLKGYQLLVSTKAIVYISDGFDGGNIKRQRSFLHALYSRKSPVNVKTRWRWAIKNGKISILYFVMDMSRILYSLLIKR